MATLSPHGAAKGIPLTSHTSWSRSMSSAGLRSGGMLFLKHAGITVIVLCLTLLAFGLAIGADAHLFEDAKAYALAGETHVFLTHGEVRVHTIRGTNDEGFRVDTAVLASSADSSITVSFPGDGSVFQVPLSPLAFDITPPSSVYHDASPIVALSDIESGFTAFRQFVVEHGVADAEFNWTFGRGHLVLVGDFVDRGASTTQVLWAAYKLEQLAKRTGGMVHFIVGNHEIKNLQGNYQSSNEKYLHIAGILGKRQDELFDNNSLLGRWLASKNVIEVIDRVAFVHGGLHPDIATLGLPLDTINRMVREGYRVPYYPPTKTTPESFLRSVSTGPAWYRGYFKAPLTAQDVSGALAAVGARRAVVGHTLHRTVTTKFDGLVVGVDVPHRKDYLWSFPPRGSEGVRLDGGRVVRLREGGARVELR